MTTAALAVVVVLTLAPLPAQAQLPTDPAERAKVVDQIFQANARQLTLFDRQGKPLSQIGTRDMYGAPALSPDGKRVGVVSGWKPSSVCGIARRKFQRVSEGLHWRRVRGTPVQESRHFDAYRLVCG